MKRERDLLDISSSSEDDEGVQRRDQARERLSKAKKVLHGIVDELEVDAKEVDRELIADRLKKAVVEAKGLKPFTNIADSFHSKSFKLLQTLRSEHRGNAITRVVGCQDSLYSADKAGHVIKWQQSASLGGWRKQHLFRANGPVLALSVSPDGRFLLAGLQGGQIMVWNDRNQYVGKLGPNEHRDAVTDICFQPASLTAFSCSADRTVKIWSVDQLAYIDTVYGHQDCVYSLCCPSDANRCVSVGGRDRTLRLWKILEESQLVFRLSETEGGSLDEVVCVGKKYFASGSDSGFLSLWSLSRKKPIVNIKAHDASIHCLYSPEMTDLVITGSSDGSVKLWKVGGEEKSYDVDLTLVNQLNVPGTVTGIALLNSNSVAISVSPEPRLGRWNVDRSIKSSLLIFSLN